MSTPKRHHYLPEFYLKGFSRDKALFVYDRELNEYREQMPRDTAVMSHYYTLKDDKGNKNVEIEKFLSRIEGNAKPIIEKLEKDESISEENKKLLSIFISFLMNRVPDFEKSENKMLEKIAEMTSNIIFQDEERAKSVIDKHERDTGKKMNISPKELVDFHRNVPHKYIINRNMSLRLMFEASFKIAHYFKQMNWMLYHASSITSFITTDNPFVLLPPAGYDSIYVTGILMRGTKKIVPLTQSICLIMFDRGTSTAHKDIDREMTKKINHNIAYWSDRFVIGRDVALVKKMVKTAKLDQWKYNGRLRVD